MYVITCCSTVDLTPARLQELELPYVCYHLNLDGQEYADDLGQSLPLDSFYQRLSDGADSRTSQVNVGEFIEFFVPLLEQGQDILHVSLSSGLTGAYNSACIARDQLQERFPDRRILVLDSLGASSGYGMLVEALAALKAQGQDMDAVYNWGQENRLRLHHWFFSTDLSWYVRGGRISKAAGWFGTALQICPLLNMDREGHLIPRSKVRTKNKVIREMVARMSEQAAGGKDYSGKCQISHSGCPDDARAVADLIEASFPQLDGPVQIYYVGTVIGSHTGPGTVALYFWGKEREN